MPYMGNRIVRCCVLVALAIVLLVLAHAMIDFTREDCLASMDMGHEPIDADGLPLELHHRVNLYVPCLFVTCHPSNCVAGRCLLCRNVLMPWMRRLCL
jgi:hypothetical protein